MLILIPEHWGRLLELFNLIYIRKILIKYLDMARINHRLLIGLSQKLSSIFQELLNYPD